MSLQAALSLLQLVPVQLPSSFAAPVLVDSCIGSRITDRQDVLPHLPDLDRGGAGPQAATPARVLGAVCCAVRGGRLHGQPEGLR